MFFLSWSLVLATPPRCSPANHNAYKNHKPHIVFALIDDLGFGDVGANSGFMSTPNIDAFAAEGVELDSYYAQSMCSPTRAALMTGRYPFRYGAQNGVFVTSDGDGLRLNEILLSSRLKAKGYKTHAVGKWHLGFVDKQMHPLSRGFDSFYGTYSQGVDHFRHESYGVGNGWAPFPPESSTGRDVHRGFLPATSDLGQYTTDLWTRESVSIIENHDLSHPLFLYLAYDGVHYPIQAPSEDYLRARCGDKPVLGQPHSFLTPDALAQFQSLEWNRQTYAIDAITKHFTLNSPLELNPSLSPNDPKYRADWAAKRYIMCGMLASVDDSIGHVVEALKGRDMWNDTLFIVSSDNGAGIQGCGSSNLPLRGDKGTLYEGGTRVRTYISGPDVPCGEHRTGLFHAVDWVNTLLNPASNRDGQYEYTALAAYDPMSNPAGVDGVDQWDYIRGVRTTPPRSSVITGFGDRGYYSMDQFSAITDTEHGRFKLVVNSRLFLERIALSHCRTPPGEAGWGCQAFAPNKGIWDQETISIPILGVKPLTVGFCELFNLSDDEGETHNLWHGSPVHLAIAKQLVLKYYQTAASYVPGTATSSPRDTRTNPSLHGCSGVDCSQCTQFVSSFKPYSLTYLKTGQSCYPNAGRCITNLVTPIGTEYPPCAGGYFAHAYDSHISSQSMATTTSGRYTLLEGVGIGIALTVVCFSVYKFLSGSKSDSTKQERTPLTPNTKSDSEPSETVELA